MLAVGLGVAGAMTQIDRGNPAEAAQVEEPTEENAKQLDVDTYYAMMRLRGELGLTHRDLSAAGCDTAATHAALTNLLDWYETNKTSLFQARNAVIAAKTDLYDAGRAGGDNSRENIEALSSALEKAQQSLEVVQSQAIAQADAGLSQSQRARLSAGRNNTEIMGSLRYVPGLSELQSQRIRDAQSKRSKQASVMSEAGLSFSQKQELDALHSDAEQYSLQVAAGEATALPIPESILDERVEADELLGVEE